MPGCPGYASDGGDFDDPSVAPAHHAAYRCPHQPERGAQIHGDHSIPILIAQAHENIVPGHARVVDQNIDLSQRLLGTRHQRLDFILGGEIAGQNVGALRKSPGKRFEGLTTRAGNRHCRALAVQQPRDRFADAAARTGH